MQYRGRLHYQVRPFSCCSFVQALRTDMYVYTKSCDADRCPCNAYIRPPIHIYVAHFHVM